MPRRHLGVQNSNFRHDQPYRYVPTLFETMPVPPSTFT